MVRRTALLQRQARLRAVERLDLAFLVDAQHQRPVRRVHVEPDDVGDLLLELRVVGELEAAHQMRLQPASAQMRCTELDWLMPTACGHRRAAPMRRRRRRLVRRLGQHLLRSPRPSAAACRAAASCRAAGPRRLRHVALLPAPHARLRLARAPHDRHRCRAHPPSPARSWRATRPSRRVAIRHQPLQPRPILRRKLDLHTGSHRDRIAHPHRTGNFPSRSEH